MRLSTVFKVMGTWINIVTVEKGALDLETGKRSKIYSYSRALALIGSKNFGFQLHLKLDETMIAMQKQADLILIGEEAFKLELLSSNYGVYIYKKDKVVGDELRSIVGGVPPKSDHPVLL